VKTPVESRFRSKIPLHQLRSSSKGRSRSAIAARIQYSAGLLNTLAVSVGKKGAKKKSNAMLRCDCQHAKSIHSRMYANQKLGTSCNFPSCRCKAYHPVRH
jgi:hypothetical protein